MSDQNSPDQMPASAQRRRSSFAGMIDLFNSRPAASGSPTNATGPSAYPGPITQAAAQAQQRRLSVTTVGLGSSPNAPSASPFGSMRSRGQSVSSAGSAGNSSFDESPFEDAESPAASTSGGPTSPFARRVSFGARALRDVRTGSGGATAGGGGNNEGFNFAENMRARAERSSISAASVPQNPGMHGRAKSVAVMEKPPQQMPAHARKPDQFQERILKGDFYMD